MNIFVLDQNPQKAAQDHCDKHVVKMVLESAQLLCGVHHILCDDNNPFLYRLTHRNHPCSIWARTSKENYEWLYNLFIELCREYTHRYGKVHATERKLKHALSISPSYLLQKGLTPFVQAMPEEYKGANPIESYRKYYMGEKRSICKWTNRKTPEWFKGI